LVFWPGPETIIVVGDETYYNQGVGSIAVIKSSKIVFTNSAGRDWYTKGLGFEFFQACATANVDVAIALPGTKMVCARSDTLTILYFQGKEILTNTSIGAALPIAALAMSSSGQTVAMGGASGSIEILELKTLQRIIITLPAQRDTLAAPGPALPGDVSSIAFSADGKLLAAAVLTSVGIWDTNTWQSKKILSHKANVSWVAFSADSASLITASSDGTSQLWSLK
jgi:WD40 repeat protein